MSRYLLIDLGIIAFPLLFGWGVQVISIPLEDFFYSYSMLSFYLVAYLAVRGRD